MNFKELNLYMNERMKYRQTCRCGKRVSIMPKKDWIICSWCGNRIYTPKGIFKKKMEEKLNEITKKK